VSMGDDGVTRVVSRRMPAGEPADEASSASALAAEAA
jgi:hypothetical protein